MTFNHRLPAILAAFLSSSGVLLLAFSGTSCEFLTISTTTAGTFLVSPYDAEGVSTGLQQASIGVLCERGFYDREGDDMWELSRIFLIVGLSVGSLTAAMAWAVASYITPTNANWKGISVFAAITAVMLVPIFILFEAEPCSGFREIQKCSLGSGAYLLIASDILFIAVCFCTQCLDPPMWALELDFWKVEKQGESRRGTPRDDEYYNDPDNSHNDEVHLRSGESQNDEDIYHISRILPASKTYKENQEMSKQQKRSQKGFFSRFLRSFPDDIEVQPVDTESTKEHEEYDFENQLNDSHLILRVIPDGKAPNRGRESKQVASDDTSNRASPSKELPLTNNNSFQEPSGQKAISNEVERHRILDSPDRSFLKANPISNDAILADLQIEETAGTKTFSMDGSGEEDDKQLLTGKSTCTSTGKLFHGVRNLTKRLTRDSKVHKKRRPVRKGYAQMLDDMEYDSDEGAGMDSPPLEVKFPLRENASDNLDGTANDDAGIQFQMEEVSSDEEDIFMENEDWVDLTAAASAGIRKAAESFDDDENPFRGEASSIGSYHSDPEPILFGSGSEGHWAAFEDEDEDDSMDDLSGGRSTSSDSNSRGRSTSSGEGVSGQRRRRATSPVESLKSHCSLLHTTIDEETEEDIQNELNTAYSISRTLSAPEPRSSTQARTRDHVLKKLDHLDLLKTLDVETDPCDTAKKSTMVRSVPGVGIAVDEGDIPMIPTRKSDEQDSSLKVAHKLDNESISQPVDQGDELAPPQVTSECEDQKSAHSQDGPVLAMFKHESQEHLSLVKHTWNEPELPTKKLWKDPESSREETAKVDSTPVKKWKEPELPTKEAKQDPLTSRANVSDDTSDTDDTGCLSRTTDSFSDASSASGSETGPRRIIVRSRSLSRVRRTKRMHGNSKSLSPGRSKIKSFLPTGDASAISGRARDIRARRIQRLKGYVPLEDKQGTLSPDRSSSPAWLSSNANDLELTPKMKTTTVVSPDEKKEEDYDIASSRAGFPEDLFQPGLIPGDMEQTQKRTHIHPAIHNVGSSDDDDVYIEDSKVEAPNNDGHEYDSMLDHLDLQLIDLRRPMGAEYGDDEVSM